MSDKFRHHLELGRGGEDAVAAWLVNERGYGIIRTADISTAGLRGPRIERAGVGFILPDLQVIGDGMTKWVEVKTKSNDVLYQKTRELRQGIGKKYFLNYLDVQDKTGLPGWLAFLVLSGNVLRMAPLDELAEHGKAHIGNTAVFNGEMIWWPIDIFDSWDIGPTGLTPQIAETNHPWDDPKKKAAPVPRQDYFKFGR